MCTLLEAIIKGKWELAALSLLMGVVSVDPHPHSNPKGIVEVSGENGEEKG